MKHGDSGKLIFAYDDSYLLKNICFQRNMFFPKAKKLLESVNFKFQEHFLNSGLAHVTTRNGRLVMV